MNAPHTLAALPHPGYLALATAATEAGLVPARPETQPLAKARRAGHDFNLFVAGEAAPVPSITDVVLDGPAGTFRLRLLRPQGGEALPIALYFHGGGYALNGIETHHPLCATLAARAGIAICSVGYSKAPEARYPTQIQEAHLALEWLRNYGAALGIDAGSPVLMGDSAGAHLALTTALSLPAERQRELAGLVLAYGMYNPTLASASHLAFGRGGYNLTTERMRWFWDSFLPDDADPADPLINPLNAHLGDLPPTMVLAAELDCLRDDSLRLAERLDHHGTTVTLRRYPELQHSFLVAHRWLPLADQAVGEIAASLAQMTSHDRISSDRGRLACG